MITASAITMIDAFDKTIDLIIAQKKIPIIIILKKRGFIFDKPSSRENLTHQENCLMEATDIFFWTEIKNPKIVDHQIIFYILI